MTFRWFASLLFIAFPAFFYAQQGTLSGTIIDQDLSEPLIGAYVVVEGSTSGTSTDFDGKYQLPLDAGTYNIVISYVGYPDKKITGVIIKAGEVNYLDISMTADALEFDVIEVTADVIQRSENSLLLLQKRSDKIQDGISTQEMSRYAVGDAAGAMKKVTGATVSGGRFIYIRGLGDRYSLSQLNGLIIPSTDPYRNSAQLDLIPTNLLENIITSKTFTPDQPGTFTGGNVDIKTKSFPEEFSLTVSLSTAFNSQNHFIDNFRTYAGGSNDYFGFDDGTRDRPEFLDDPDVNGILNTQAPLIARLNLNGRGEEVATAADRAVKAMNNNFVPTTKSTPVDHGVSLSFGNQYKVGNDILGVILAASFKQNYQHLERFQKANWILRDINKATLDNQGDFEETISTENPTLNGMLGLAYKLNEFNSITLTTLYNHSTNKTGRFIFGERPDNIVYPDLMEGRSLVFNERELINFQLGGEHVIDKLNQTRIEWKASKANSTMLEPDTRFFENQVNVESNRYSLPASNISRPFHFFRDLQDEQLDLKLDIEIPLTASKATKLKFGTLVTQKDRTFNEWRYQIEEHIGYATAFGGDVDAYLSEANSGIVRVDDTNSRFFLGNYLTDVSEDRNNYTGKDDVTAFYGMTTIKLSDRMKFVGGARYEKTDIEVISDDETRQPGEIKDEDILPSAGLIYSLNEDMNIRLSYSQTLARPNMREIAPFESFDVLTKEIYLGNPNLDKSKITNFDARWEWFMNPGELFALSGYYKQFDDPITQFYRRSSNPEIQFTNVNSGELYGLEIEFRKDLVAFAPWLENFKFNTNFSLIHSSLDAEKTTELDPDTRPFEGQADFILNAAIIYSNQEKGIDATLALNTIGDRLRIIGREGTPDIFDRGRSQLDFNLIKKYGDVNLKFTVKNILNDNYLVSSEYKGAEYVYSNFRQGVSFGFGVSYTVR